MQIKSGIQKVSTTWSDVVASHVGSPARWWLVGETEFEPFEEGMGFVWVYRNMITFYGPSVVGG